MYVSRGVIQTAFGRSRAEAIAEASRIPLTPNRNLGIVAVEVHEKYEQVIY